VLQRDVLKETVNESRDRSGDREDRDVSRGEHKLARDHLERVALEGASFIAYLVKVRYMRLLLHSIIHISLM